MPDPIPHLSWRPLDSVVTPKRRRPRPTFQSGWAESSSDDGIIDVSVCIANWNCQGLLRVCLESLHDFPHGVRVESIVVDNASSDGAAEMVAREFPEVLLIRNAVNRGFARASNQAAERSCGRYLLFLNNDTVVPGGALFELVDFLDEHPDVGIVGPRLRDGLGRTQVSYRQRPTVAALLHRTYLLRWTRLLRQAYRDYRRQDFDPEQTRDVEVLMGAALLVRREVFFAGGRWDEDFTFGGEDIDLSLRIGRSHRIVYHAGAEITHYGRVSTRLNIQYSSPNIAVGFARSLRKCGTPPAALLLYKLIMTLDAPLHMLIKFVEGAYRRIRGRRTEAEKSLLVARGMWHFLTRGLTAFWRA
jgi:GT2 family glycosyltransferase